jgi:hypothetical protein
MIEHLKVFLLQLTLTGHEKRNSYGFGKG